MDEQFWIKAWNEGRTAFHQPRYHEKLTEYFPQLGPQAGQKVLVPLCGKTKDMVWLHRQGLKVRGVELHEQAVKDFFSENELFPVQKTQDPAFVHYTWEDVTVSCGDFFKLGEKNAYDFIYDRGALVALPSPMRKNYARVIRESLKGGGKYLLIAYDYEPSKMEGPPFSVGEEEIRALYQDRFTIRLMESKKPIGEGARLSAVESLRQSVYLLQKTK
jgi:thiopurine S-methyltransferase